MARKFSAKKRRSIAMDALEGGGCSRVAGKHGCCVNTVTACMWEALKKTPGYEFSSFREEVAKPGQGLYKACRTYYANLLSRK
jgi:transposase-like protein